MVDIRRSRFWMLLDPSLDVADYDDLPILPADIDPQMHLSLNSHPQPFWLACEKDVVIATLAGTALVELRDEHIASWPTEAGDYVYVPARTPHRIVPDGGALQMRYKALVPGLEAAIWYCTNCTAELWRHEFDTAETPSQRGWQHAADAFNDDAGLRTCAACGTENPPADLTGTRWAEVADALDREDTGADAQQPAYVGSATSESEGDA